MTQDHHIIDDEPIGLEILGPVTSGHFKAEISEEFREYIRECRIFLDEECRDLQKKHYGINTGFGALYDKTIPERDLESLQEKLILSHACGMGNPVRKEIVRLMLYLKARSLSYGHSGVQESTVDRLLWMLENDVLPVVPEQGSLGASGDLAPLAHLSLPLIGRGKISHNNVEHDAGEFLRSRGLEPLHLQSKEGLALLNGTQFMAAHGLYILGKFHRLLKWADIIAAISLEGYDGRIEPFHPRLHDIRGHAGQNDCATRIRQLLEDSQIIGQNKEHVQDPYSFRCIPQVHGASNDTFWFVYSTFINEINAVTDNPNIFPEEKLILSGGNFHGQPLALGLDFLSIATAEIGSISERRSFKLLSGNRGLPEFLTPEPGLNSGFMICQYTAASMVSANKQWCTPASVDTIDSSKGQEDHVSMGANAALKALKVVENLEGILGIELLLAAQALEFRRPLRSSEIIEKVMTDVRSNIPFLREDAYMKEWMDASVQFITGHDPDDYLPYEDED